MNKRMLLAGILWIILSCSPQEKVTIEDLRQEEIQKRIDQYIENKKVNCYKTSMDKAIKTADSLLKLDAVKYVEDSLKRPPLPTKPHLTIKPPPKDSIQNQPFQKIDTIY